MREIRTSGSTRGREVADQSVAPRPTLPAKCSLRERRTNRLARARQSRIFPRAAIAHGGGRHRSCSVRCVPAGASRWRSAPRAMRGGAGALGFETHEAQEGLTATAGGQVFFGNAESPQVFGGEVDAAAFGILFD